MAKKSNEKDSVLAVLLVLLLVFQYTRNRYFVTAAIFFIVIALLSDRIAIYTDIGWKKLTQFLGLISSAILFSVLFYLIVFPLGMILKLSKKQGFIRFAPTLKSTLEDRNKLFTKVDLKEPF